MRFSPPSLALLAVAVAACHGVESPRVSADAGSAEPAEASAPMTTTATIHPTFDADQKKAASTNPTDLHFTIAVAGQRTRFLRGEAIPIELRFSSDVPNRYRLDKGLYDRIGRLSCDAWILDRDGTVDPLADYFANGIGGMGGLRQMPILDRKVETMTFSINEWHRFDRAGHYRLYVTSSRIEVDGADGGMQNLAPTSNVVEFDVALPTAADDARLLQGALALLSSKKEEDRNAGVRALRFLGSEAALREMIDRFTSDEASGDLEFGIIGSPHRALAISTMQARLKDDVAIPTRFLHTLALLLDRRDDPSGKGDWTHRSAKLDALAAEVASSLGGKSPKNRALSAAAVLELGWSSGGGEPAYVAKVMATLPIVFADLPSAQQTTITEYRWKRAKDPALAPALRAVYDDPKTTADVREAMLHRLLELDPAGAKTRILDRLRTGKPDLGYRAFRSVGGLPDPMLPALDGELAARLEADAYAMPEVARYASPAIAARVKHVYAKNAGEFTAEVEGAFLDYFLRVEPAYGEKAAQALLTGTHSSAGSALAAVASRRMTPALEKIMISGLASPNLALVSELARALGEHGTVASQGPLWKRLADFNATFKGREADLAYSVTAGPKNQPAVELETVLWHALLDGRGWLSDRAAIVKAQSLVVRSQEKEQVGYHLRYWEGAPKIEVGRRDDGEIHGQIAQYEVLSLEELEEKISQFPKGTTFALGTIDAEFAARLKAKLAAAGMKS